MPSFGPRSTSRLNSCHEDLIRLFTEVVKEFDCTIICGHRDARAQNEAFVNGFSKVDFPNSKHNKFPSLAVDVGPWPLDFNDYAAFEELGKVVLRKAAELGIKVKWGRDFKSLKDYPHWELVNHE
jgi:peptidoglycan L-alanyl-D-glutamate endopeptidase CwlK